MILLAGAIVEGNEFVQNGTFNWKAGLATVGAALFFAGLESLDQQAAVGLAAIVIITVLVGGVTPGVKSPAAEVASIFSTPGTPVKVA
jgi:hypothetical protein